MVSTGAKVTSGTVMATVFVVTGVLTEPVSLAAIVNVSEP